MENMHFIALLKLKKYEDNTNMLEKQSRQT